MTEAIFGLIGVVIGGGLNLVGLCWIERRRDRRTAQVAARILRPGVGATSCSTLWRWRSGSPDAVDDDLSGS